MNNYNIVKLLYMINKSFELNFLAFVEIAVKTALIEFAIAFLIIFILLLILYDFFLKERL
jgi:hypothetical protein